MKDEQLNEYHRVLSSHVDGYTEFPLSADDCMGMVDSIRELKKALGDAGAIICTCSGNYSHGEEINLEDYEGPALLAEVEYVNVVGDYPAVYVARKAEGDPS